MITIKNAHYLNQYKLCILFNNNEEKIVDLEKVLSTDRRPIFRELMDINKFKNFEVAMDTIVWQNGLDLAPEFLYDIS